MGMFDKVQLQCPCCGQIIEAQSKSGECNFDIYTLDTVPINVIGGICWPTDIFICDKGTQFIIKGTFDYKILHYKS